jgi:hypothetical protein
MIDEFDWSTMKSYRSYRNGSKCHEVAYGLVEWLLGTLQDSMNVCQLDSDLFLSYLTRSNLGDNVHKITKLV